MTCHRLDDELLGDLGDALDPHVAQCPDCSARAQGYRRIAGWVADGRTMHRPPADWRQRTLARVLAGSDPLPSVPTPPGPPAPVTVDAATDRPAAAPDATRPGPAAIRRPPPASRPRRRWVGAVIPLASAAIVLAVAIAVIRRGDPRPPRVVEAPRPASHASDPARGAVGSAAPAGEPSGSTQPPTQAPRPESSPRPPTTRGADVVVDWPSGSAPGDGDAPAGVRDAGSAGPPRVVHVAFDPPAGDLGGLTTDEIQRVVKARAGAFRTCYTDELRRTPGIAGTLIVRIRIGGDGRVQAVNRPAPEPGTLRSAAVAQCVIGHLERLVFPSRGRAADLTGSLTFTQGD